MNQEFREKLADLCHEQWSGWMRYLFSKCHRFSDGKAPTPDEDVVIPQPLVERWMRQMNAPYFSELSEKEKNSDRKEADKFITLIVNELLDHIQES